MMSEVMVQEVSYEQLRNTYSEGYQQAYDFFANKSLRDVMSYMPEPTYVEIDDSRQVLLYNLLPEADVDETRTVVFGLPFANGMSPHQFIRAKALQLMVGPEVPLIAMPNNTFGNTAYSFTAKQRSELAGGSIRPLGEIQMAAIEKMESIRSLGAVQLTGYSQGALTVLAMGAVSSAEVNVTSINADEAPSNSSRGPRGLRADFRKDGLRSMRRQIKEVDIDALTEATRSDRLAFDIAKFGLQAIRKEGRYMQRAMSGTVDGVLAQAASYGVPIKLGYVTSSPIFDPESVTLRDKNVSLIAYSDGFEGGHASAEHIIKGAFMAKQGINL